MKDRILYHLNGLCNLLLNYANNKSENLSDIYFLSNNNITIVI